MFTPIVLPGSWLVMGRPVAYYFERVGDKIYDVHAMGNPFLWWFSTGAILVVFSRLFNRKERVISAYLICNYIANLLPWLKLVAVPFSIIIWLPIASLGLP